MKMSLGFAILLLSLSVDAHEKNHQHREHGSHVHGEASLSVAFEGVSGKINFESPAGNLFGFEHKAKTPKDKAKVADVMAQLKKPQELFAFENLKCEWSNAVVEQDFDGHHSEVEASFDVKCDKAVIGQTLDVKLGSLFSAVKELKVEILADDVQLQKNLKSGVGKVEIKK